MDNQLKNFLLSPAHSTCSRPDGDHLGPFRPHGHGRHIPHPGGREEDQDLPAGATTGEGKLTKFGLVGAIFIRVLVVIRGKLSLTLHQNKQKTNANKSLYATRHESLQLPNKQIQTKTLQLN